MCVRRKRLWLTVVLLDQIGGWRRMLDALILDGYTSTETMLAMMSAAVAACRRNQKPMASAAAMSLAMSGLV